MRPILNKIPSRPKGEPSTDLAVLMQMQNDILVSHFQFQKEASEKAESTNIAILNSLRNF